MRRDREAEARRDDAIRRTAERWLAMSPEARRAEVSRSLARIFGGPPAPGEVDRIVAETDAYYRLVGGEA